MKIKVIGIHLHLKVKKVNKAAGKIHYKPGERREKLKAKTKQEDFSKVNYQSQFPQLGANPIFTPGQVDQLNAGDNQMQQNQQFQNIDNVMQSQQRHQQPTLQHKDSAPLEAPQNKVDPSTSQKAATRTPQPVPNETLNMKQGAPMQMPPQMQPGMPPNMQPGMQMPYMGQMVYMMPQMGMKPQPFMMHPQMHQFPQNFQNQQMAANKNQNMQPGPMPQQNFVSPPVANLPGNAVASPATNNQQMGAKVSVPVDPAISSINRPPPQVSTQPLPKAGAAQNAGKLNSATLVKKKEMREFRPSGNRKPSTNEPPTQETSKQVDPANVVGKDDESAKAQEGTSAGSAPKAPTPAPLPAK